MHTIYSVMHRGIVHDNDNKLLKGPLTLFKPPFLSAGRLIAEDGFSAGENIDNKIVLSISITQKNTLPPSASARSGTRQKYF